MGSSFSPQSELTHLFLGLAQPCGVATRCRCDCIMRVAQGIKGHADLASSSPSSQVSVFEILKVEPLEFLRFDLGQKLKPGQSRQTLVTGNEGCVRYPT